MNLVESRIFGIFYILSIIFILVSCQNIPNGELNPVNVSGCEPHDHFNPCITSDVTTPNERTAVCSSIPVGWAFRANKYLINANDPRRSWRTIIPRTGTPKLWESCSQYIRNGLLVEGEYALTPRTNTGFTTALGDICSPEPTIVIYRFESDWLMKNSSRSSQRNIERFRNPMYEFYVGAHNARWMQTNMIDRRILAVKDLIAKQCVQIPDKIIVLGRFVEKPKLNKRGKLIDDHFISTDIYSGVYYPKIGSYKLVPDNQEIATELRDIALNHRRANSEALYQSRLKYERRMEKSAFGLLLMGLGAFAIHKSSPCNDPNISDYDKPSNCR